MVASPKPSIFSTALKYTSVFSAVLYFGGFAYVKYLFKQFSVDIWELKLGFVEVIPFFWSAARHLARSIFESAILSVALLILAPLLFASLEYGYRVLQKNRALTSQIEKWVGFVNARFYLPTIAMLLVTYIFVLLIHEAAHYHQDIIVRQQRTVVTLAFKTPDSEQKFTDMVGGKNVYFFAATQEWFFLFTCQQDGCSNKRIETLYVPRNTVAVIKLQY
jgi:hypothetical protein